MEKPMLFYAGLLLLGVFLSAISQVMLKKAALRQYPNKIREYLNPLVIIAYTIFVGTTFLSIYAYKGIPPEAYVDRAWAAALTLILIVMALNLIARLVAKVFAPKTGR